MFNIATEAVSLHVRCALMQITKLFNFSFIESTISPEIVNFLLCLLGEIIGDSLFQIGHGFWSVKE